MEQIKEKIALFDFCETIANFQTADKYIDFVRAHVNEGRIIWYKRIHTLLSKTRAIRLIDCVYPKNSFNKCIYALQLKGLSYDKLDSIGKLYYEEIVRPNLIPIIIKELERLQFEGFRIVLVSGGYDFYLKYFAEDYGINLQDIISTTFSFKNGICTGRFKGKDCMYEEKVRRLNAQLRDYKKYSVAYSDSESDIPMLRWAKEAIVVREKSKKRWTDNFKEIIWER